MNATRPLHSSRPVTALLVAICAGLLFVSACKSDCRKLCDKQAECAQSKTEDEAQLGKESELCKTMCETMNRDPAQKAGMEAAFACADKPCDEFAACVKAAGAKAAEPKTAE